MTTEQQDPGTFDDDEDFDAEDEPVTDEQLANVGELVEQRAAVEAVEDPEERKEAARWYQAALSGEPEPEELWI